MVQMVISLLFLILFLALAPAVLLHQITSSVTPPRFNKPLRHPQTCGEKSIHTPRLQQRFTCDLSTPLDRDNSKAPYLTQPPSPLRRATHSEISQLRISSHILHSTKTAPGFPSYNELNPVCCQHALTRQMETMNHNSNHLPLVIST